MECVHIRLQEVVSVSLEFRHEARPDVWDRRGVGGFRYVVVSNLISALVGVSST